MPSPLAATFILTPMSRPIYISKHAALQCRCSRSITAHFKVLTGDRSHHVFIVRPLNVPSHFLKLSSQTVHTEEGDVAGTHVFPTVRQFLGIPFASTKRWEAPQPAPLRDETFDASQFGNSCFQTLDPVTVKYLELTGQRGLDVASAEDCLTVNIWTPSLERKQKCAVLLWVHGGGFSSGTSNLTIYRGENLVRDNDDIILITFNYRLNIFGQPGAPQLIDKSQSQNFGLLDVEAAIRWVHANIVNFGGDPNRITIFGQSAGSVAADLYILSHPDDTIVKGVIQQSGSILGDPTSLNTTFDATPWNNVAMAVGCGTDADTDQLTCMRITPAQTLEDAIVKTGVLFNLVADDITVFSDMQTRIDEGNFLRVPLLSGSTQHESDVIVVAQQLAVQDSTIPVITEMVSDVITQLGITCPAGGAAIARTNFNVPAWRYQYQAVFPNLSIRPDLRCYHGSDIPMVFGTFMAPFGNVSSTPTEISLSKYMQSAWVSFARDPRNGLTTLGWPIYNPNTTSLVQLGNPANTNGTVFGSGSLLDSSCSNRGTLLTITSMLSALLSP